MEQEKPLLAWFGDPDLKARVVAKMKQHRADDEFIQGLYQTGTKSQPGEVPVGWKGCAIGCTLPYIRGDAAEASINWHGRVQSEYGISYTVAEMIDSVFEEQRGLEKAGDFAVAVIEAIPVGADLTEASRIIYDEEFGKDLETPEQWAAKLIELLATAPVPEAD